MIPQRYFYLKQKGRIFGPFPAAQLLQMYRSGTIKTGDQISPDKQNWQDAVFFFTGRSPEQNSKPDSGEQYIKIKQEQSPEKQNVFPQLHKFEDVMESEETEPGRDITSRKNIIKETEKTSPVFYTATAGMFWLIISVLFLLTLLSGVGLYIYRQGLIEKEEKISHLSDTNVVDNPANFTGSKQENDIAEMTPPQAQPQEPVQDQPQEQPQEPEQGQPQVQPQEQPQEPEQGQPQVQSQEQPQESVQDQPQEQPQKHVQEQPQEPEQGQLQPQEQPQKTVQDQLREEPRKQSREPVVFASKDWTSIIRKNKEAIGVVVFDIIFAGGKKETFPIGTAWVNTTKTFVTNAHVINSLPQFSKLPNALDVKVFVAMNGKQKRHLIHAFQIHPNYLNGDPAKSDFAVLHTADKLPAPLHCATKNKLQELQQGDEIMYLGFPMEGLDRGNLNVACPIATMQCGNITAISDTSYGDSGFSNNTLIRHNLPVVGGASGSPIFARNGNVIAILFAGNITQNVGIDENGKLRFHREASAAMINFAIRIDCLEQCLRAKMIFVSKYLKGEK